MEATVAPSRGWTRSALEALYAEVSAYPVPGDGGPSGGEGDELAIPVRKLVAG